MVMVFVVVTPMEALRRDRRPTDFGATATAVVAVASSVVSEVGPADDISAADVVTPIDALRIGRRVMVAQAAMALWVPPDSTNDLNSACC